MHTNNIGRHANHYEELSCTRLSYAPRKSLRMHVNQPKTLVLGWFTIYGGDGRDRTVVLLAASHTLPELRVRRQVDNNRDETFMCSFDFVQYIPSGGFIGNKRFNVMLFCSTYDRINLMFAASNANYIGRLNQKRQAHTGENVIIWQI